MSGNVERLPETRCGPLALPSTRPMQRRPQEVPGSSGADRAPRIVPGSSYARLTVTVTSDSSQPLQSGAVIPISAEQDRDLTLRRRCSALEARSGRSGNVSKLDTSQTAAP
ncbi:MAG: hypothetical protein K2N43_09365 [Lachnospiraceae bacterium]|nr:hypothetical protein [Lachnospiraceae bacterium]